jgi:hypothetical protein
VVVSGFKQKIGLGSLHANDGCNSELVSATTAFTTSENLHLEIAKGD